MRISDSHKMLFVHVQKTGGSSLDRMLQARIPDLRNVRGGGDRHEPLRRILAAEPELRHYWIFGFVRNPWDRMVSWWAMVQQAKENRPHDKRLRTNARWKMIAEYPDFATYIMKAPEDSVAFRRPQIDFLTTRTRRADLIGRQESYGHDVRAIFARLDLPIPELEEIEHRNVSHDRGHYRDYYTPATRDRVAEVFNRDLEVFGYEF